MANKVASVGFLGAGHIASALIRGLLAASETQLMKHALPAHARAGTARKGWIMIKAVREESFSSTNFGNHEQYDLWIVYFTQKKSLRNNAIPGVRKELGQGKGNVKGRTGKAPTLALPLPELFPYPWITLFRNELFLVK